MNEAKLIEILTAYNGFWKSGAIESGIQRDILSTCLDHLDVKEVMVIMGVRRGGKSTLVAQIIDHLLTNGVNPASILRVNLEEPLFSPEYSPDLLEQIYRIYRERVYPQGKAWIFLDEIQNIPRWEAWVRGRSESEDVKLFVTGSSAQMLSREIGTKLTGRHISFEVYPLSFGEYLRFKDIFIRDELDYANQKVMARNLFLEYLHYGGFPEVVLRSQKEDKEILLKQYFEDILYRDIATRYEIRDTANLRNLLVYLLTNISRPTSINKLRKNFTISQDKTENYVSAILESCLVFQLQKSSFSLKAAQRAGFKPYGIDTGVRNRVAFSFSRDMGHLVENAVFCHLKRRYEHVFFLKNDTETDFVVKEGLDLIKRIQVWYDDAAQPSIPDRELASFRETGLGQRSMENILITNDYEDVLDLGCTQVLCIPAAKYLLFGAAKMAEREDLT